MIVLVGLVKAVSSVSHDHVQELLEDGSMEIILQILAVGFVEPKSGKYFIGVEPVLELFIESTGSTCNSNATVESNESIG